MGRKQPATEPAKPEPAKPEAAKEPEEPEDPPMVKELKGLDDQYLALEREYEKEATLIARKYTELQKPLLSERAAKIAGGSALPDFWSKALRNHPLFEDMIEEWDRPVLSYLTDITIEDREPEDPNKGFKIFFHFAQNPYFTNKVLAKTYVQEEESPYRQDYSLPEITADEIDWKDGKDVTVEKTSKKVKGGGAKKSKQKAKEMVEPRESFFRNFFRTLKADEPLPDDIVVDAEMMDSDDGDEFVEMIMDRDHAMGDALKEQIVPFAVRWYTGEAKPEDSDDDEDEDDDNDDDDDDDDDDDGEKPLKGKQKQEECKQQ